MFVCRASVNQKKRPETVNKTCRILLSIHHEKTARVYRLGKRLYIYIYIYFLPLSILHQSNSSLILNSIRQTQLDLFHTSLHWVLINGSCDLHLHVSVKIRERGTKPGRLSHPSTPDQDLRFRGRPTNHRKKDPRQGWSLSCICRVWCEQS
jgi:hypothetical protein